MTDEPASNTSLESLKKNAKRWLKDVRAGEPGALARLRRAYPNAPATPTLRDVQHALARERGFEGWLHLIASLREGADATPELTREQAVLTLLRAAEGGDADAVADVLDHHPDIINERGLLPPHTGMRTALHFVTSGPPMSAPHDAVMRLLLERGANPNIRDEGDWAFPLHFVAERGRLDLVRLLIEHGADPIGAGDYHDLDVIGWATAFDYVTPSRELVDYLLAHGAGHTIFSAVATGDTEAIHHIVAASPSDLEKRMDRTNHRRKPLHLAVVKRQREALASLLKAGADPNPLDEAGLTPLDQAVLSGQLALAQMLVDRGAEVTLAAAVVLERRDDIERLLAKDPDGLRPGHRWGTLIIRASEYARGGVIERLIQLGASVDAVDDTKTAVDSTSRYTALHAAAWRGNTEAARVLLEHGANPRIREEKYCGTPAGWADYAGHPETRDAILAGPIDLFDAVDHDAVHRIEDILAQDPEALNRRFTDYATCRPERSWCTPLAAAVLQNKADAARILLSRGANLIQSPEGQTLLEVASEPGREEVRMILEEFTTKP
jgi:ankyrin repeat protein